MLEGYFDDGGTHDSSEVVVWGGVMGDSAWFEKLEGQWLSLLRQPLEGKPPIKQFHHAHLSNSWNEFRDYKPPERDLVIKRFRDAIIAAGLVPVSFSVVLKDWRECVVGNYADIFGTAEQFSFMSCVYAAHRMARIGSAPVALQFDTARLETSRQPIIDAIKSLFPEVVATIGFGSCESSTGLQAADLVAYESYLLSGQIVREGIDDPRPHLRRLLEGVPAAYGFILRKQEILRILKFTDAFLAGDVQLRSPPGKPGFQNIFDFIFRSDDK
jgi:hypothetical protein